MRSCRFSINCWSRLTLAYSSSSVASNSALGEMLVVGTHHTTEHSLNVLGHALAPLYLEAGSVNDHQRPPMNLWKNGMAISLLMRGPYVTSSPLPFSSGGSKSVSYPWYTPSR